MPSSIRPNRRVLIEADRDQAAFREGLFVRALGRPCNNNPYPSKSKEAARWEMGWRFVDGRQESVRPTNFTLSPARPVSVFTPDVAEVHSHHEHAGPPMVDASLRRRLVDAAIILAFVAMLGGMWLMMQR